MEIVPLSARLIPAPKLRRVDETKALVGTNGNVPNSGLVQVIGEKSSLLISATGNASVKIELGFEPRWHS